MYVRSKGSVIFGGVLSFALALAPWRSAEAYSWEEWLSLKSRVQRLEDIEAIKDLKHRYIVAIDAVIADPNASAGFVDLLDDDFIVEYDDFGTFTDKPSLQAFLEQSISPAFAWGFHAAHNPRIHVDGDQATGEWYFTADAVYEGTTETVPFWGRYVDHYVRTCDGWKIDSTVLTFDSPPLM